MTAFIAIATVMVAVALAWIVVPLLRRGRGDGIARRASNLAVYRDQLAELENDLARGTLSAAQHADAKAEIERRVIDEVRGEPQGATLRPAARGGTWTALALGAIVPVVAVVLYFQLGTPDALSPQAAAPADAEGGHAVSEQQVQEMVARLAERLQKEPDNLQGWAILARSYYVMGRFGDAAAAYERVVTLQPKDADALADYADALAMSQGRKLQGKPMELVKRALAVNPTQWKALAMAGTEAFDRKDYKGAVTYWEKLRTSAAPDSPMAQAIQSSIDEARELGGMKPRAPAAPSVAQAMPGPGVAQPPAAAASAASGEAVSGTVTISPGLVAKASPDDTVFIFARAATGPKMPLAIVRKQVKDLPFRFSLDDSMAMTPSMKLSNFPEVVIGARVSKSGQATPQSGDLEGLSKPVRTGAANVAIVIDSALP